MLLDTNAGWWSLWLQFGLSSLRLQFVMWLLVSAALSLSVAASFSLSIASLSVGGDYYFCHGYTRRWLHFCSLMECFSIFRRLVSSSLYSVESLGHDLSSSWLFFPVVILFPLAAFAQESFICLALWSRIINSDGIVCFCWQNIKSLCHFIQEALALWPQQCALIQDVIMISLYHANMACNNKRLCHSSPFSASPQYIQ